MTERGGMSDAVRTRVLDAVLEELARSGIDDFSVTRVARRAGIDPDAILAEWRDRRVLLMAALVDRADRANPCPDTGSLGEDLAVFATTLMEATESTLGRRLIQRLLPAGRDTDMSEVGQDLLTVRFESLKPMLDRAAERGELRPGVDPDEAIRMICTAYLRDAIFRDTPVRPEYAAQVRDIVLHGVLAGSARDGSLANDFTRRENERSMLRAAFDAMVDPAVLIEAVRDDDGHITDFAFREVNPAACENLVRSRGELIGAGMNETLPELYARCVHTLETGRPLLVEDLRRDVRVAPAGADRLSMTWRDVTDRSAVESAR